MVGLNIMIIKCLQNLLPEKVLVEDTLMGLLGMALCPSDGVAARGFVNGRGPKPCEALAHGRDRTEGPYRSEGHRACRMRQKTGGG